MKKQRITYLLGAGASANAVPVVADFKDRIIAFKNYLGHLAYYHQKLNPSIADFFYQKYNWLLAGIEEHTSPDYFAMFLGITSKESGNRIKLIELKLLLSLFFVFEQSKKILGGSYAKDNYDKYNVTLPKTYFSSDVVANIDRRIDPRYRVFWQDIFTEKSNRTLPENVNVVTWNYDLQLEMSFVEFETKTLGVVNQDLQIIPNSNGQTVIDSKFSIVKVNGTAGLFHNPESKKILDGLIALEVETLDVRTIELVYKLMQNTISLIEFPLFYFSWEENEHTNLARKATQEILSKTDVLIVIGYSFPDYNKKIDASLFTKAYGISEIIIQVKDNKQEIEKRLKRVYPRLANFPDEIQLEFDDNLIHFHSI